MAAVTVTKVRAFAFCPDARCPGNRTAPVNAASETTEFRYSDLGGDMPADPVERTFTHLRFADEADASCPAPGCERLRDLSLTDRPVYASTGYDPLGLLKVKDMGSQGAGNDAALAEAIKLNAALMQKVHELERSQERTAATLAAALEPVTPPGDEK